MLIDSQLVFSNNQSITTGNIISQNVIKIGKGDLSTIPIYIQVAETFSNLTTLTVNIETSSVESFATVTNLGSENFALSKLKKGKYFDIRRLPVGSYGYIRLKYTVSGTAETTGKINAGISTGVDYSHQDM